MKPTAALRSLVTGSILLTTLPLQAGNRYWKGGSDFWDTLLTYWGTSASGPYSSTWVNNNTAVFGGTAGTVTLNSNITVGGLRFDTTGYIIDASASTLSFGAGDNTILFNNIAAATINNTVGGSGNVILTAANPVTAGTLTLGLTSTAGWTGSTTINAGMTMSLSGANRALSSTSGITLNGGGITLTNTNSTQGAFDRVSANAITSNGGTITYANTSVNPGIYAETIGSVALTNGQLNIVLNTSMAAGTQAQNNQTLTLGGLTRTGATNTSAITFAALTTGPQAAVNRNMIVVSGAGTTTSGQIIGPWATVGTAAGVQTDYAIYNANYVVAANIGATAENSGSWVSGANVTLSAATTLTATRTVNSLRYTGAVGALALGTSTFNLETYGILNGGTGTLTVSTAGTGGLTTPSGGGNLYLNAGNRDMIVSAPINNNGSDAVTVVTSGSGRVVTLSSTTGNYSGGTVVNSGTLTITADSNLGASTGDLTFNGTTTFNTGNITLNSGRDVTVNSGAIVTLGTASTGLQIAGALSGTGTLVIPVNAANTLSNAGGFTGTITTNSGIQAQALTVDTLGDGGLYFLGSQSSYGSGTLTFNNSSGATSFGTRQFVLGTRGGGYFGYIKNNNANGSNYTVSISTDMAIGGATGAGFTTRRLLLGGTNTDDNKFTGKLGDGTGSLAGVITSLGKSDAGTWSVSGDSTFTGTTTTKAGTLVTNKVANSGLASPLGASSDSVGMGLVLYGGTLKYAQINGSGAAGHSTDRNFIIAASSTIDASGTGALQFTNTGTLSPDLTGQSITTTNSSATVTVTSTAGLAEGMRVTWNGGAKSGTVSSIDSATQFTLVSAVGATDGGNFTDATYGYNSARTLTLTGTNTDANTIAGVLQNSSASGAGVLSLTKSGTGTWVLSGANTYTGTTTAGGGILKLNNANALPGGIGASGGLSNLTITGGGIVGLTTNFTRGIGTTTSTFQFTGAGGGFAAYGGDRTVTPGTLSFGASAGTHIVGTLTLGAADSDSTLIWSSNISFGGSQRTVQVNNGSAAVDARLSGVLSGAGSSGIDKTGAGTLEITSTSSSYTGATTVTGGTLIVNGNISTSSLTTVQSGATLKGQGTVGALTVNGGGTLASGTSIESLASGDLTLLASAIFEQEIDKSAVPGVSGDLTVVTGTLTLANSNDSILKLVELGTSGAWTAGDKITLIGYSTGTWNGGLFTLDGGGVINDGSTLAFSGINWTFNYDDTTYGDNYQADMSAFDGNARYVTMTAVPEPRAALLGGIGMLMLLRRRRN